MVKFYRYLHKNTHINVCSKDLNSFINDYKISSINFHDNSFQISITDFLIDSFHTYKVITGTVQIGQLIQSTVSEDTTLKEYKTLFL